MFSAIAPSPPTLPVRQVVPFTAATLKEALPVAISIGEDTVGYVNRMLEDATVGDSFREGLLTYSEALKLPHVTFDKYAAAVTYTSFVLCGYSYTGAYEATFPDKVAKLREAGASNSVIASHAAAYKKGKLVSRVLEQAIVPHWVYNQGLFQEALETQADIMRDVGVSARDRVAAAESVLKYTQIPASLVSNKEEVGVQGASVVEKLLEGMARLTEAQTRMLQAGSADLRNVANCKIINEGGEV